LTDVNFYYNIKNIVLKHIKKRNKIISGGCNMEFEKIKEILAEQLGVSEDEIKMDSSLTDDLGADSLDLVELIMALEQEFDLEISDEEAEKIKTVGDAVNFVKEKAL
jgi:acyl carrier protein